MKAPTVQPAGAGWRPARLAGIGRGAGLVRAVVALAA